MNEQDGFMSEEDIRKDLSVSHSAIKAAFLKELEKSIANDYAINRAAEEGVLPNDGMHDSIFVKVWGDAGGGDAGRRALANYAFELGRASRQVTMTEACIYCGGTGGHFETCQGPSTPSLAKEWK